MEQDHEDSLQTLDNRPRTQDTCCLYAKHICELEFCQHRKFTSHSSIVSLLLYCINLSVHAFLVHQPSDRKMPILTLFFDPS